MITVDYMILYHITYWILYFLIWTTPYLPLVHHANIMQHQQNTYIYIYIQIHTYTYIYTHAYTYIYINTHIRCLDRVQQVPAYVFLGARGRFILDLLQNEFLPLGIQLHLERCPRSRRPFLPCVVRRMEPGGLGLGSDVDIQQITIINL